jgi:hypothetical protein
VRERREAWAAAQPELDPARLVFVDESGADTKMARRYGRSPRGARCRAAVPHGHWKTTTLVAGLRLDGVTAPMVLDGAMDGEMFLAWTEQMLAPSLRLGDLVIMDNLPAHKVAGVREAIRPPARDSSISRPIPPTSIQSRRPSPRSRHSCEKPPPGPSPRFGTPSPPPSTRSPRMVAPTTSPTQDMSQPDRKLL